MSDLRALEHSTLKVPYEILNKKFRIAQKIVDREIDGLQKHPLANLHKVLGSEVVRVSEASAALDALEARLDSLSAKAADAVADETAAAALIQRRIAHLKDHPSGGPGSGAEWRAARVDRLVIEYLLRAGYYRTAAELAAKTGMEFVSNLAVFLTAQEVEESLAKGETARTLEWCHENRSKLRRLGSRLELHVRVQEFVELLRARRSAEAVAYARAHFKDAEPRVWADELGRVVALLAFGPDTDVAPYAELYSPRRWDELIGEFVAENFRLYQLAHQSVFSACLQSGLSALKTPHCEAAAAEEEEPRSACPVCIPDVFELARGLPFAHASHSRLVCPATQRPIDDHNPPLMLPNGMVYGRMALEQIAAENGGEIVCPRTGLHCSPDSPQRVFIM